MAEEALCYRWVQRYSRITSVGRLSVRNPRKTGWAKLVVAGPLGELDLGNEYRLDPNTPSHNRSRERLAPTSWSSLWQVNKGAGRAFDLLHSFIEML
jgi:hypothetical protein